MANSISTSTNALATAYPSSRLVALSASGDAFVLWFDGTNVKYSYASSPYSSWTTTTLLSSIGGGPRWQGGLYKLSNDNVLAVVGNASGNIVSYLFTYSSGGHSWSAGSAVTVEASASAFNGGSAAMDADAQGRIWVAWANNSHVVQVYYTSNNGTSWNASTTFTQVGGGLDTNIGLAYCGNFIVCVYCASTAAMNYATIDAHNATLGSWSSSAAVTNCSFDNTLNAMSFRGAPGSNYGVLVGDEGAAIPAEYFNANTNTWSSVSNIGASSSDHDPTLITDGTNLFCVWSKFSATNNYFLVYKKWTASTQTWDSSSTQLETNGTNIQWANGGYGNSTLGFVYGVGTASPWTVSFDTASFGATTNTYSFTDGLTASDTFSQTDGTVFSENNTITETLFTGKTALLTENNPITENLLGTDGSSLSEGNTISDVFFQTITALPTETLSVQENALVLQQALFPENNSANDQGQLQTWNVDTLTVTDQILQTDGTIFSENTSIVENSIEGTNFSPQESLSLVENTVFLSSFVSTENLSLSKTFFQTNGSLFSESLVLTDSFSLLLWSPDNLSIQEGTLFQQSAFFVENLSATDTTQIVSLSLFSENYSISEGFLQNENEIINNQLSLSDLFSQQESAIFFETPSLSEFFLSNENTIFSDVFPVTDILSGTGPSNNPFLFQELLALSESSFQTTTFQINPTLSQTETTLSIVSFSSSEQNTVVDSFLTIDTSSFLEGLTAQETENNTQTFFLTEQLFLLDTTGNVGPSTINYPSTNSLVVTSLFTSNTTTLVNEVFSATELFSLQNQSLFSEAITLTSIPSGQSWQQEALSVQQTILVSQIALSLENNPFGSSFSQNQSGNFFDQNSCISHSLSQTFLQAGTFLSGSSNAESNQQTLFPEITPITDIFTESAINTQLFSFQETLFVQEIELQTLFFFSDSLIPIQESYRAIGSILYPINAVVLLRKGSATLELHTGNATTFIREQ